MSAAVRTSVTTCMRMSHPHVHVHIASADPDADACMCVHVPSPCSISMPMYHAHVHVHTPRRCMHVQARRCLCPREHLQVWRERRAQRARGAALRRARRGGEGDERLGVDSVHQGPPHGGGRGGGLEADVVRAAHDERAARVRPPLVAARVRGGVLGLVERLAHAARVVVEQPAVHHELDLPRGERGAALRAVGEDGELRPRVAHECGGVDREVVAGHGLRLIELPRRAVVALPPLHLAPVTVRVQLRAAGEARGKARDHLLAPLHLGACRLRNAGGRRVDAGEAADMCAPLRPDA